MELTHHVSQFIPRPTLSKIPRLTPPPFKALVYIFSLCFASLFLRCGKVQIKIVKLRNFSVNLHIESSIFMK